MELTKVIARNIVQTQYDNLPTETREATKRSILDAIGVMFPPSTLEKACVSLYEIVKETGGKEESTIVGFGGRAPCREAAFVNGSLVHALDYDDVTDKAAHHPSASTVPAALAVAEKMGKVNGKAFITAIAVGNDLGVRLASTPKGSLWADYPWFPISIFGAFTAAVAPGKLLGLSEEQMINALGIALQRAFGISEAMTAPNSVMRAIRDGFTNKEGILCALMAGKGITACKDGIEKLFKFFYKDQYDPQALTSDLGKKFRGTEAGLKPWPSCRETHSSIQAALDIVKEHNIKPEQIEGIALTVGRFAGERLCEPPEAKRAPKLSIDAKFSLPYTVGVALVKRKVEIADFLPENLNNPEVLGIAKKVSYKVDPEFPGVAPSIMTIKTKEGKLLTKRVDVVYGNFQNPLSKEGLAAKFRDCVHYSKKPLSPEKTGQVIEGILNLEQVKDIREITNLLS